MILLLCCAAAPLAFLLHLVMNWVVQPGPRQRSPISVSILVGMLSAAICSGLAAFLIGPAAGAYALVTTSCICFCYFILFTMSETARRIHLLVARYAGEESQDKPYSGRSMVATRLDRLANMGVIYETGGKYFVRPGLMLIAALFFDAWGRLLFGKREL